MIIGTYSGGSASAYEYSTLPELLNQIPDNSGNLIDAVNIRNSVYTLWEKIEDVQTVASQSASASVIYSNSNPTLITVGGIPSGTTFSNRTMKDMWDALLYPYIAPSSTLSGGNTREFGSSNALTLNWSVTKGKNSITSIIVNGVPVVATGNNQSGSQGATVVQNVNTTLSMSVSDGTTTSSSSTSVTWRSAVYWGKTATFSLPSMSVVGSQPAWADGAGVGSGKALASTRNATYSSINGAGGYLVFSWPSTYGTPSFTINGMINTAFTKIGNAVSHTNQYNYTINYDVWISNTAQNSPIGSLIIS
jgi:hypothetical protein